MIAFTKKKRPVEDDGYTTADTGYTGYDAYDDSYAGADFGAEMEDGTVPFTEPGAVDPTPESQKSTIKLMRFSSPAEREKVADCLKNGYAVIFDLDAIDRADWYRVIDYVQGAIYMIGGSISRFSEFSLIAAPKNFDVSKLELDDLAEEETAEAEEPATEPEEELDVE